LFAINVVGIVFCFEQGFVLIFLYVYLFQDLPQQCLNKCVVACQNKLFVFSSDKTRIRYLQLDVDGAEWSEIKSNMDDWANINAVCCKG